MVDLDLDLLGPQKAHGPQAVQNLMPNIFPSHILVHTNQMGTEVGHVILNITDGIDRIDQCFLQKGHPHYHLIICVHEQPIILWTAPLGRDHGWDSKIPVVGEVILPRAMDDLARDSCHHPVDNFHGIISRPSIYDPIGIHQPFDRIETSLNTVAFIAADHTQTDFWHSDSRGCLTVNGY